MAHAHVALVTKPQLMLLAWIPWPPSPDRNVNTGQFRKTNNYVQWQCFQNLNFSKYFHGNKGYATKMVKVVTRRECRFLHWRWMLALDVNYKVHNCPIWMEFQAYWDDIFFCCRETMYTSYWLLTYEPERVNKATQNTQRMKIMKKGKREPLLLGTAGIYFKARKLKELSVSKYAKI